MKTRTETRILSILAVGLRVVFEYENVDKVITLTNNATNTITVNDGTNAKTYQISGDIKDCEDVIYPNAYFSLQGLQNKKIS